MKKTILAATFAVMAASSALAADLGGKAPVAPAPVFVSPWDFAISGGLTSNYLFRGISQSNNRPSVNVGAELRYNISPMWQLYAGAVGSSIKLTNFDNTSPGLELDILGGVRATVGDFSADFGGIAYTYHGGVHNGLGIFPTNPTFYEGYAKLGYKFTDWLTVGANAFYTPSFLDTGSSAVYVAGTAKVTLPYDFAVSGEFGRQYYNGLTDITHGLLRLPDYNYWNAGLSYTYKFATLDLRYHGTSLNKTNCAVITGPTNAVGQSKYCGQAFVATLSFALEGKDIK